VTSIVSTATSISRHSGKAMSVSGFTFFMFILYQLEFFLHASARIPGLGVIRPALLMFAIITILLFFQREKFSYRFNQPIFKAFSAFLLMLLLTLPFVKYPGSVVKENFSLFMKAIVFLYFSALILDSEKRLKISLFVFVSCQIIRILEPLYLNITSGYWGSSTHLGGAEFANRLSGAPSDVINPNELGFVIATVIPFLHYFLLPKGFLVKITYFFFLTLLFYALILTMSRGAFLALLVVGWFVFKDSNRKVLFVAFGIIIAVVALGVMNDNQKDRYLSLFSSDAKQSSTAEGRITGMMNEFKLGFERPIFGFGLGTTAEAKFNTWGRSKASHNMYGEILIETGLVGLFFFLRFVWTIRKELKVDLDMANTQSQFYKTLFKVLNIVFWMFAVYSINYWGLSQYYWYNLAGLVIAASFLMRANSAKENVQ
jgi:putative inorganic carbon (HCO3(-)) transporter